MKPGQITVRPVGGLSKSALEVILVLAMLLATACASSQLKIRTDSDPSANFSQYKSFNFFDPMGIEGGYNSPIYGQLFRESISSEMRKRNYRESDAPDLMVNVTFRADDQVKVTSYVSPYMSGAYYSSPGGAYYGSGLGVGVGVSQRVREVTQLSVFIDLVDPVQHRVVWQGVAVLDVTDKVAQQLRDATFTAVDAIFKQYPHRAGE